MVHGDGEGVMGRDRGGRRSPEGGGRGLRLVVKECGGLHGWLTSSVRDDLEYWGCHAILTAGACCVLSVLCPCETGSEIWLEVATYRRACLARLCSRQYCFHYGGVSCCVERRTWC